MKITAILQKYRLVFLFFMLIQSLKSQTNIHTKGAYIVGPCDDTLILRGINYAPYNWGWDANELLISEIAKTGANCLRLPWYKSNAQSVPNSLYTNYAKLDSVLSKCIQNKIIPLLDLHDETCKDNAGNVLKLSYWYTQPQILTIISKYKKHIMLNIANEALYVGWNSNIANARTTFVNTYKSIIDTLRNAGINAPLVIDAPDCGTSLTEIADLGQTLITHDPLGNIILSAHAYWYSYANNDSTQMAAKINYALSKNIPFILGEIANQQDDASLCQYNLNYKPLLNYCQSKNISWMAWSWFRDGCPEREISSSGNANMLTTYGNDIVNNKVYGIKNTAVPSKYLKNGFCSTTSSLTPIAENSLHIFPNPAKNHLNILIPDKKFDVALYTLNNQLVCSQKGVSNQCLITIKNIPDGIYYININLYGHQISRKLIISNHD